MAEIEKFNPSALQDAVRQRVQSTFAELIPKEHWDALVKKYIDEFLQPKPEPVSSYYGSRDIHVSDLQRVVVSVLRETTVTRVKEWLAGPEWTAHWDGQKNQASERVTELVVKNAPELLSAILANAIQGIVNDIRYKTQ